jgi:UDP:flavonoid glycosyltransferase YjiC (YdhE family)
LRRYEQSPISTEDKMEVAARVAYSGVGTNLKTSTPTPAHVRAALQLTA